MCKGGNASTHATKLLIEKGYENVFNINNGIMRYRKDIDDQIPNYWNSIWVKFEINWIASLIVVNSNKPAMVIMSKWFL